MSTTRIHRMSAFGLAALATAALVTGCSNSTDKPAAAGQATGAATGLAGSAATGVPAVAGSAGSAGGAAPSPVKATGGGKFCQQVADSMNNDVLSNPPENSDDIKTQVKAEQALEVSS